ncbi:hypothetical protein M2451_002545 [Dysgonomonas sp. PFB1-18]|nr:hypothetical protein [Dysgonomonas sp. PF1-14]MDH6339565.1 hypothetical protein [Dysgonomonas sp. PF1-16]MDH6381216.1 hypothetical protein [Dysgonomonas sp. PFB1-18]MDH6398428.1 hypothetical protein [Dysgonomonas sp. PF1-23]
MILILSYKKYRKLRSELKQLRYEHEKYKNKYEHLISQIDKIKQPSYCQNSYCDFCEFSNTNRYAFNDPDHLPGCILGYGRNFSK